MGVAVLDDDTDRLCGRTVSVEEDNDPVDSDNDEDDADSEDDGGSIGSIGGIGGGGGGATLPTAPEELLLVGATVLDESSLELTPGDTGNVEAAEADATGTTGSAGTLRSITPR
jgi:hypothetical protein